MGYLTAQELSNLIDCQPTSYACMRRWLARNGWPYEISKTGLPKVSRAYHDGRMRGNTDKNEPLETEPNFGAL